MNRTDTAGGRHRYRPTRPRPATLAATWREQHPDRPTSTETRAARRARLEAGAA